MRWISLSTLLTSNQKIISNSKPSKYLPKGKLLILSKKQSESCIQRMKSKPIFSRGACQGHEHLALPVSLWFPKLFCTWLALHPERATCQHTTPESILTFRAIQDAHLEVRILTIGDGILHPKMSVIGLLQTSRKPHGFPSQGQDSCLGSINGGNWSH